MTDRTVALDILSNVSIASPCNVSWESMKGDNRVRFCDECHLNVYNLSDMKAVDAVELIQRNEGRICISFFRRTDGTILTSDCPKGLRRQARWVIGWLAASLAGMFGVAMGSAGCALRVAGGYRSMPEHRENNFHPTTKPSNGLDDLQDGQLRRLN